MSELLTQGKGSLRGGLRGNRAAIFVFGTAWGVLAGAMWKVDSTGYVDFIGEYALLIGALAAFWFGNDVGGAARLYAGNRAAETPGVRTETIEVTETREVHA